MSFEIGSGDAGAGSRERDKCIRCGCFCGTDKSDCGRPTSLWRIPGAGVQHRRTKQSDTELPQMVIEVFVHSTAPVLRS